VDPVAPSLSEEKAPEMDELSDAGDAADPLGLLLAGDDDDDSDWSDDDDGSEALAALAAAITLERSAKSETVDSAQVGVKDGKLAQDSTVLKPDIVSDDLSKAIPIPGAATAVAKTTPSSITQVSWGGVTAAFATASLKPRAHLRLDSDALNCWGLDLMCPHGGVVVEVTQFP